MTRPRLLIVAALVTGLGLLGSAAQGVGNLDRELAAAADVAAKARALEATGHDRDCPWRERRDAAPEGATSF